MDTLSLDELERLAKAATPGPWFVTCNCTGKTFYTIKNDRVYIGEALGVYNGEANAAYITAACNSVPELIKRVRELEFQLGEVEFDNSGLCRENDALKRQRDWLAQKCEAFCLDSDLEDCPHCPFREETPCFLSDKESWIKFAEQAAKEANDA